MCQDRKFHGLEMLSCSGQFLSITFPLPALPITKSGFNHLHLKNTLCCQQRSEPPVIHPQPPPLLSRPKSPRIPYATALSLKSPFVHITWVGSNDSPLLRRVSVNPSRYPSLSCRSIPASRLLKQEWDYVQSCGRVKSTYRNTQIE